MLRIVLSLILLASLSTTTQAADPLPNIVFIMADDLGCFELGCYGQKKIRTPSIDKIAETGIKFNRWYSGNAVCAPSRCCLMTGKHPGHAFIRDNKQPKGEGLTVEGQWPIPASEICFTEVLKNKGYVTGAMGKWGLGMFDTTGSPLKHGFDYFYGYNCQAHAHTHYPTYLWQNDKRIEFPGNKKTSGDTYSHDLFEKEALKFIDDNKAKPFFLYLPFTVPHMAMQVPEDSLNEYKGKFGDDPPYKGKSYQPHDTPRAAYAAMVTRMDRSVGRIMDKLKELKLDSNTIVFFTSDNGPGHNYGGIDTEFFQSASILRGLKGSLYEGGIRAPMVVSWPGKIKPGTTNDLPFAHWDVFPTMCELAGSETPMGLDGLSCMSALLGKEQERHKFLYWEFPSYMGQQAIQFGDWKAIRQKLNSGVIKTELYNLKDDPSEKKDLALNVEKGSTHAAMVQTLELMMAKEHTPSKDFPLKSIDTK